MQRPAPSLPTDDELDALRWPLLDVARMLRLSRFVLELAKLSDSDVSRIAAHLARTGLDESTGLPEFDSVAREVNNLHATLGPDGWTVPPMPADQYPIQAQHVAATAALMLGRRLLELQPGMSRVAIALSALHGHQDRLKDLELVSLAAQCCRFAAEAVFIEGRAEMRTWAESAERQRRKEAGRKGGAPSRFTDAALLQFMAEWQLREGKKRGAIKAAARHFDVTDTAIGYRLKRVREKPEAT